MTVIGWIQILVYCAIVIALVVPLGGYMTRVFNGERTLLSPVLRPVEAGLYWLGGVDEKREQHWVTFTVSMLFFHVGGFLIALRAAAPAGRVAVQPGGHVARWRRICPSTPRSASSPTPTGRTTAARARMTYLAQMAGLTVQNFVVRRHRHRAGGGADPRLRPRLRAHHRQFLGRSDALHALRPPADLHRLRAVPGVAGRCRRRSAPMSRRPRSRVPSRPSPSGPVASQVAIKMLGTNGGGFFNANAAHPFENPTALVEFRADDLDLRDRRRAHQRVRPHGRQPAPGLGDPRGDGRPVPRRRHGRLLGRRRTAITLFTAHGPHWRQHGGQGGPLRHRGVGAVRRRSRPPPPAARSTPCTTASPRSAA